MANYANATSPKTRRHEKRPPGFPDERFPACGPRCLSGHGNILVIRLKYATLAYTPEGCTTTFQDGATADAAPHDLPHYHVVAHRLGYGDDLLAYCREHEFCHLFIEERLHDRPSLVLWSLAHGTTLSGSRAAYEEIAAQSFQRWLRANERPITSGVDWDGLKRDALRLLAGDDWSEGMT